MELIQDRVEGKYRSLLFSDEVLAYIANQIEMAYIAGANRVQLTSERHLQDLLDVGPVMVDARNYVKDKGYRL